jgi:DNA-directed RNA polymerase III subunit RPC3
MQLAGMVDIQEVPRDASRTTQRTMFLWYFDAQRATAVMVDGIYKAMSRSIQRLEVERRRASGILSMAERSDVRTTSEEEVLSEEQMDMLKQIRAKEDRIMGQIARLDDLVGIFRDF